MIRAEGEGEGEGEGEDKGMAVAVDAARSGAPAEWAVEGLLGKCEELVGRFEYDLALKFCERILAVEGACVAALQIKATIMIDTGRFDAAREALRAAVAVEPLEGHEKFVALAQLSEGEEAVALFGRAVALLQEELAQTDDAETAQTVRSEIASVFCSLAELYMTDLCFAEEAEETCQRHIDAALEVHPAGYEALQTLASMRISQDRVGESLEALQRSLATWSAISVEHADFPSYEFRLTSARLLVELQQFSLAQQILDPLTQEDDEITEAWYLLALAHYSQQQLGPAHEALQCAEKLLGMSGDPIAELADAVRELRTAIGAPAEGDGDADAEDGQEEGHDGGEERDSEEESAEDADRRIEDGRPDMEK